jgi:hypothetical protein
MRTIKVCSGIGDNIWLLMKLINSNEEFNFQLPDNKPQRGKQIFDLLPTVAASATYVKMKTDFVEANNIQMRKPNFSDIKAKDFYLSCNKHLEQGRRIENFFPDLPTSFRIQWDTEQYHTQAMNLILDCEGSEFIGLYGSSYSTTRAWGFWDEHKWLELAKMIRSHNSSYKFVVIGAEWDLDLGRNLVKLFEKEDIPYVNTIGQPLGVVIEIMKKLKYFFSFPSGLGILAPTVSCPVTMFYPPHLKLMMNAWASDEDIDTGQYKGCQFCEPEAIFKWTAENNKI